MANHKDIISSYYRGKRVFFTGCTGMLGIACISRLVQATELEAVYALVKGGEHRFWTIWEKYLPADTVEELKTSSKIIPLDGSIDLPKCGLAASSFDEVQRHVSIIIHADSVIDPYLSLKNATRSIILPTLSMMEMGLSFPKFSSFVYLSTTFTSIPAHDDVDKMATGAVINPSEEIKEAESTLSDPDDELNDIKTFGKTVRFNNTYHPSASTYAMNLTERLLLKRFHDHGLSKSLLIFCPSLFGPSEKFPHPGFEIAGDSPVTTLLASMVMAPPWHLHIDTFKNSLFECRLNEIPIDIVANQLLCHVAFQTQGCVHAVVTENACPSLAELWNEASQHRKAYWGEANLKCNVLPIKNSWKLSGERRLIYFATISHYFKREKTKIILAKVKPKELKKWPLDPSNKPLISLENRQAAAKPIMRRYLELHNMPVALMRAISSLY